MRAVLFEAGAWVTPQRTVNITHIPVRQTALQQREVAQQRALNAMIPPEQQILGTSYGRH